MTYSYGMKYRPFGLGCQPSRGLLDSVDTDKETAGYWSVITYSRELTPEEVESYELTPLPQERNQD